MASLLHDVLGLSPSSNDHIRLEYLARLTSLSVSDLQHAEPERLSQSSHTSLLTIQSLSKRSHKAIIDSVSRHASLRSSLPMLGSSAAHLKVTIPQLDAAALKFSETYSKTADNETIARRRQVLLLLRNVDRVSDLMELPILLSSAASAIPTSHTAALDLSGHVQRTHNLYPNSPLVSSISTQTENVIQALVGNLLASLRTPTVKLAASLRAMGSLRRILPDIPGVAKLLENSGSNALQHSLSERALGALFLLCRLDTLVTTLDALDPLRILADEERSRQATNASATSKNWASGQQTERYLKRYIEIFREQSFGIVSMYKSLFANPDLGLSSVSGNPDPLQPGPPPLTTFALHLVEMLMDTLREYLVVVRDKSSCDSILTQVLYCAGSLGRLGIDFSILLADLDEMEWIDVVKRHRLLAGRLESVLGEFKASGSGTTSRKTSESVASVNS